jgi:hypothetical protein
MVNFFLVSSNHFYSDCFPVPSHKECDYIFQDLPLVRDVFEQSWPYEALSFASIKWEYDLYNIGVSDVVKRRIYRLKRQHAFFLEKHPFECDDACLPSGEEESGTCYALDSTTNLWYRMLFSLSEPLLLKKDICREGKFLHFLDLLTRHVQPLSTATSCSWLRLYRALNTVYSCCSPQGQTFESSYLRSVERYERKKF